MTTNIFVKSIELNAILLEIDIEKEAMKAENQLRLAKEEPPAYGETDFALLVQRIQVVKAALRELAQKG